MPWWGYCFDAGASVFYGFGENSKSGTLNLHTRIFRKLGIEVPTIHDPVQIHFHLPNGFEIPAEKESIAKLIIIAAKNLLVINIPPFILYISKDHARDRYGLYFLTLYGSIRYDKV